MRGAVLSVTLVAVMAFAARAQEPGTPVKTAIELPKVEGWVMGTVWKPPAQLAVSTTYKAKVSGAGKAVNPYLPADVRIYRDKKGTPAGDDLEGAVVTAELARLDKEITGSPIDKDVKQVKREKVALGDGGPQAWRVEYTGKRGGDAQATVLYLTVAEGNFVSVKVTERAAVVAGGEKELAALMAALGKAIGAAGK